jgi:hypothetical protein
MRHDSCVKLSQALLANPRKSKTVFSEAATTCKPSLNTAVGLYNRGMGGGGGVGKDTFPWGIHLLGPLRLMHRDCEG